MNHRRRFAFTLIELLVVIGIIVMLIAILLPALMGIRRAVRQQQNGGRIHTLIQAMDTFAQGNRGYYPGLDKRGVVVADGSPNIPLVNANGDVPRARFAWLIAGAMCEPKVGVNPIDPLVEPYEIRGLERDSKGFQVDNGTSANSLLTKHLSYAMMDLVLPGSGVTSRRSSWTSQVMPGAPIIADRNTGNNDANQVSSVWTERDSGTWSGSVGWGDGHVSYEQSNKVNSHMPGGIKFGDEHDVTFDDITDNLFVSHEDDSGDGGQGTDAALVYRTNSDYVNQDP